MTDLWKQDQERIYNKQPLKVGVVGYSSADFNQIAGASYLIQAFNQIEESYGDAYYIVIVSGLTALGIPLLAYKEADKRGWSTKGIACGLAKDYECYPVDEEVIFGDNWGDESNLFLNDIDFLVRVGGGDQSFDETAAAYEKNIPVLEFDL